MRTPNFQDRLPLSRPGGNWTDDDQPRPIGSRTQDSSDFSSNPMPGESRACEAAVLDADAAQTEKSK